MAKALQIVKRRKNLLNDKQWEVAANICRGGLVKRQGVGGS